MEVKRPIQFLLGLERIQVCVPWAVQELSLVVVAWASTCLPEARGRAGNRGQSKVCFIPKYNSSKCPWRRGQNPALPGCDASCKCTPLSGVLRVGVC